MAQILSPVVMQKRTTCILIACKSTHFLFPTYPLKKGSIFAGYYLRLAVRDRSIQEGGLFH